jgi:ATP-dependent Clp protease ATP-binding subunit ClpC
LFKGITDRAQKILTIDAPNEVRRLNSEQLFPEHIIMSILKEGEGTACRVLHFLRIDKEEFYYTLEMELLKKIGVPVFGDVPSSKRTRRMLDNAVEEAKYMRNEIIGTEHIMLASLMEQRSVISEYMNQRAVTSDAFRVILQTTFNKHQNKSSLADGEFYSFEDYYSQIYAHSRNSNTERRHFPDNIYHSKSRVSNSPTPTLDEFTRDLTALARDGKLDPVIGREKELNRAIRILARRTKNNPLLVGEPGVGKTSVVEGLACILISDDVPPVLADRRILSLDLASIVAGTKYRGEFEERLKKIMAEISQARNIILFIDEIHTLIGAGGAEGTIDASNILKPALSRGDVQCIGATTSREYRRYFEKDTALDRRFQIIRIEEPDSEETLAILQGIKNKYEQYHGVTYTDEAIFAAVNLAERYITERSMPDKVIDILDEAGAMKKLESILNTRKYATNVSSINITDDNVRQIISESTGIPVMRLREQESKRLVQIESELHKTIVGQNEAVNRIAASVRRSRSGISSPLRPLGSFIFLGPTGVGKTLLAKALAEYLFGTKDALVRIDMSDFMEKHNVSRLVGAPPGYIGYEEGGILTEQIRRNPYRVVLFDEIEKAHRDVFNLLLQVLEEGELKDNMGHTVSFRNTLIIMTSNAGAREITMDSRIGFKSGNEHMALEEIRSAALAELKKLFNPEFINRVDDVVVFHALEQNQIEAILDLQLEDLFRRVSAQGFMLNVTDSAKRFLMEKGWDPKYGARPMRRTIQKELEDPLSIILLSDVYPAGSIFTAEVHNEKIHIRQTASNNEQPTEYKNNPKIVDSQPSLIEV